MKFKSALNEYTVVEFTEIVTRVFTSQGNVDEEDEE